MRAPYGRLWRGRHRRAARRIATQQAACEGVGTIKPGARSSSKPARQLAINRNPSVAMRREYGLDESRIACMQP
jgi:hypothetical protein